MDHLARIKATGQTPKVKTARSARVVIDPTPVPAPSGTAATGSETFKLYLAHATFQHQWGREGAYLCRITGPDGFETVEVGPDPSLPVPTREANPLYAGFLRAARRLPEGITVEVITKDQHLYGTDARPGTFNTTPAEREARGYLRANPKDGFLENVDQLREIDAVLKHRRITTSARRPDGFEEERHHAQVAAGVKELLRVDPTEAPWDR